MSWFACGAAAVAVVSSAAQGAKAAGAASKASVAENEAVIKANVKNTIRTGYRVGLANMQRGLQKRQEVQAGYEVTKGGQQALGQVTANAAASGSVGASVDAVVQDIQQKIGDAQANLTNQAEINQANFNTQIEGITFEGEQALQEGRKANIQSNSEIMGTALMAGVSSFASSYAGSKMKLGATPSGGTPSGMGVSTGGYNLGGGSGLSNMGSSFGASTSGSGGFSGMGSSFGAGLGF